MKIQYIKTEVQGGSNAEVINELPYVNFTANVSYKIVETGVTPTPENETYYSVSRTAPKFSVQTDSVLTAMAQVDILGLAWLKSIFGDANVIV